MATAWSSGGIDPKATEAFLLTQQGVLDASVWMSDGRLHAHVTLPDDTSWSASSLQRVCAEQLGLHQTPARIHFFAARRRAA